MNLSDMLKKNRYFGLDIGSNSVKLAEFRKSGESIKLVNAKLIELNIDPTSNIESSKKDYLIRRVIEKLLDEVGATSGNVAIAVSGQSVFIRFVRLPKVAKRKVEQIVKYEAQLQVPFPINEVIWDYQVFEKPDNPEMEVTLVAVKRDIIEASIANLKNLKCNIEYIDVIPLVLYNLANFVDNYEGKIILDIGAKITNIIIADKAKVWTRSILIAGDEITKAIANALQVSFLEAESIKKKEGIIIIDDSDKSFSERASEISSSITPVLVDIITDISKTIGYYKSQFGDTKVFNEILLTGGSSKLRNIEKFFRNNLEMKMSRLNIFEKLGPSVGCEIDEVNDERFGVALGLGIRHLVKTAVNINLIPKEIIKSMSLYKKRWYIFSAITIVCFIVMTINGFLYSSLNLKKEIKLDMDNTITLHSNYNKQLNRLQKDMSNITEKLEIMNDLSLKRTYWLDLMSELNKAMPASVWLVSLEKSDNNIFITGKTAASFSVITDFKNLLKKSKYFKNVEIKSANVEKKTTDNKDLKIFSLRIELNKDFYR